jgi:cytochrome c oxidase subunit I
MKWPTWPRRIDTDALARGYLISGLVFLALGGALAVVMRWQHAFPGQPLPVVGSLLFPGADGAVTPPAYSALFTSHGLIMIFFAATPILIGGIGTFLVPREIGTRGMALPGLTLASFLLTLAGQICALVSILVPNAPSAGWTSYPPLATGEGAPGPGQTWMVVAILCAAAAAATGGAGVVATVVARRRAGLGFLQLPLSVWGFFLTAALNVLFAPILFAATLLLLVDRLAGTDMFGGTGGDPVLYQHLFWLFGHPEVYIVVLPVWGLVGALVARYSGKPPFFYKGSVLAMITVASMSALVYGHHMFRSGLTPLVGGGFEALTLLISAPGTLLFANWLATLWRGSLRLEPPMLFALGTIAVIAAGGLTGILLATVTTDVWLHDSMWVVGHFHLMMASAVLLGSFAGLHLCFEEMFGRVLDRRLAAIHFAGTLVFALLTFGGLLAAGHAGQPRRYADGGAFSFLAGQADLARHVSYSAFALAGFQLLFFVSLFTARRKATE